MEWFDIEVTIDGETFEDGMQGVSVLDALERAWENWEDAEKIKIVG
jgi:hypothetical protein